MDISALRWAARTGRDGARGGATNALERSRAWRRFWKSYRRYRAQIRELNRTETVLCYPVVGEDTGETAIEPTYFYQDAWAFEKIVQNKPATHIDVASHHKFVALLSKVVPLTMIDIRPLSLPLESLHFRAGTILDLPFEDGTVDSISSMCVIEHIGLGRYGDPLDPLGTEKAIAELKRVLAPGGSLYVSVPIDRINATLFNANRLYREEDLLALFAPFEVMEKRYIFGNEFTATFRPDNGVGCYWLRRPL